MRKEIETVAIVAVVATEKAAHTFCQASALIGAFVGGTIEITTRKTITPEAKFAIGATILIGGIGIAVYAIQDKYSELISNISRVVYESVNSSQQYPYPIK